MAINFPDSPANNDQYTIGSTTWMYNGTAWVVSVGDASIATGAITTDKIAAGAVTAAKLGNDISLTPADGSITAAKIASDAVTTAKILDANVTTAKVAANAITQAKLAANVSGITITTTANRGTDVASPFTGQTIFLSDVTRLQVWNGSAWTFITNGAPGAPTSLSATPLSTTSVSVAFTTGTINGAAVTNYKYAYSSNAGSTYSEYAALDPVDIASPVVISGLTGSTAYLIKLRAVSDFGDSVDSSAVSVTTLTAPSAPTSLSATGYYLSAQISFTAGADGGSAITNYEYALSTNAGSTYGSYTALSPTDTTSPIEITGLANNTTYSVKLRAVSAAGNGAESSAVSVTTNQNMLISYLVVAGGGGGGRSPNVAGGGGGAGGVAVKTNHSISIGTNYGLSIGAGGAAYSGYDGGANPGSSSGGFGNTLNGGGTSGYYNRNTGYVSSNTSGGSGGGGSHAINTGGASVPGTVAAGATFYGNAGGNGGSINSVPGHPGGGGGGAGAVGATVNSPSPYAGAGGVGISNSLTGSAVFVGGGGGGSSSEGGQVGGNGGGGTGSNVTATAGTVNTGGGGGGSGPTGYDVGAANPSGAGGSGLIVLQYSASQTITVGAGLTASHTNTAITVNGVSMKYTRITAGSGNVSWA